MTDDRFDQGVQVRREVLGEEHVQSSLRTADDISRPLQHLITEYAWGTVWARPGLPRRERSLITVSMLIALNRPHELAVHIRGAARNGCTRAELGEVVLQSAIYCGGPAALAAMRVLQDTWPTGSDPK